LYEDLDEKFDSLTNQYQNISKSKSKIEKESSEISARLKNEQKLNIDLNSQNDKLKNKVKDLDTQLVLLQNKYNQASVFSSEYENKLKGIKSE